MANKGLPTAAGLMAFTLAIVPAGASASADDEAKQLRQCQQLKQSIERYTRLRKAGGSARQMERWKQARRAKKAAWDQLRCQRIRRQLK